ncbi:NAD-dependent epimerase/dehydratase family protein [Tsukamurella asaccharolytica]|uniref:NAD-dependent epimerase/dehydratase family protein n=1 Tax=Tsukamurella asaccharolytica TaxID=2592067 RepID=A0A5C5R365_9ACTN|nr:NAD(P)H-binding protein [Tsukamurella asaccharolytica]TWS17727.1 NAD-dependent epimerase/dehydratase family protein [Tsukamurella asaccharolytica]
MKEQGIRRVCIVGASGKLGRYMVDEALRRGYEVVGVCRERSVGKLADRADRITVVPGDTNDAEVIRRAVAGCDGVLTVLVPWGVRGYSSGTAQAVLDAAEPDARLIFSCGWHVPYDATDRYSKRTVMMQSAVTKVMRAVRVMDIDDQVEAARRIYASTTAWTLVRASSLEEGPSQGLPIAGAHVGDPVLASDRTRRVDYALYMVEALTDDTLIRKAPAIVGCAAPSALAGRR